MNKNKSRFLILLIVPDLFLNLYNYNILMYLLMLNTGIGNLLIEYFSLFFLIINILTLAIIYYISRNYYLLIPNQMLFFVIGYQYNIQYYSFYFVMLSVFILSLFIAQKVMGKLTGSVIENEI